MTFFEGKIWNSQPKPLSLQSKLLYLKQHYLFLQIRYEKNFHFNRYPGACHLIAGTGQWTVLQATEWTKRFGHER